MLGRAAYLPLIFFCFSLVMVFRISALVVFLHLLYLVSYGIFYYDDVRTTLGLDKNFSFTETFNSMRNGKTSFIANSVSNDSLIVDFVKTCY